VLSGMLSDPTQEEGISKRVIVAACRTYREQAHYTSRILSSTSSLRSRLVGRSNPCVDQVRWIATSHHVPSCRDSWLKATDAPFHEQGLFYRYFTLSKSKSPSKSKSYFIPFSFEPRLRHCESRPVGIAMTAENLIKSDRLPDFHSFFYMLPKPYRIRYCWRR
jgi:hypothetical protein